ncbi:hypothetical protein, partial [Rhodovarius sp.]|uniref:hypothetical protein n=1 Tax=Rhodovarius sp. TaxID=2972673 RepID=UPI00334033AF
MTSTFLRCRNATRLISPSVIGLAISMARPKKEAFVQSKPKPPWRECRNNCPRKNKTPPASAIGARRRGLAHLNQPAAWDDAMRKN